MKFIKQIDVRHWILPLSISLAIILSLSALTDKPSSTSDPKPSGHPFTSITFSSNNASSNLVAEHSLLMDTEPIFLPSSTLSPPTIHEDEDLLFKDFRAITHLNQPNNLSALTLDAPSVKSPRDTLIPNNKELFTHFGKNTYSTHSTPLPQRTAHVCIHSLSSSQPVKKISLDTNQFPSSTALWKPTELLIFVDQSGIAPNPLLAHSTKQEEVDNAIHKLFTPPSPFDNLMPGYYKVIIAP